jgi:hypothetical protein
LAELVDACEAIYEPARGLPPPREQRTPAEQAAVDAQVERVRQIFGIPAGGLAR